MCMFVSLVVSDMHLMCEFVGSGTEVMDVDFVLVCVCVCFSVPLGTK